MEVQEKEPSITNRHTLIDGHIAEVADNMHSQVAGLTLGYSI